MKYFEALAWATCQSPGCDAGRTIDSWHAANLAASGGYHCPEHEGGA